VSTTQLISRTGHRREWPADRPIRATVGIPTFHRPERVGLTLAAVLRQVAEVNRRAGRYRIDVLVVDNDAEGGAREEVHRAGSSLVRYVVEPTAGISAARNRMIDECADSDVLVCIDDDENPHAGWLLALLDRYRVDRPAAVYGRVVAEFDGALDPWIASGRFFARFDAPDGAELDAAAAGNLLLDLGQLRRLGLRFDSRLGLSGGEDTLLTRTIATRGGRIVRCSGSVVTHRIGADRMTRPWVLQRSWSHGNSHALITVLLAPGRVRRVLVRGRVFAAGLLRAVTGSTRFALGVLVGSHRHQARGLRTALRGAGMAAGAAGYTFQEYARRSKKGWF
jgi:glycosyltransferase involved in cell wall biosynthesis